MPLRLSCSSPVLRLFSSRAVAGSLHPPALLGVARPPAGGPAFASWLCALWERHEAAQGGGASCLDMRRPGSGALPRPTACPWGVRPGACYPLAVGAGDVDVGSRHQTHSARSSKLALRALGAARGRPGGVPLAWLWGVRGWTLSPRLTARPWGVRPGPATHWLWVGDDGVGTRHQPHSARSCELALRAAGAARGSPGGGVCCLGVGRPGFGALPRPTAHPWGVRPGPATLWLWVRGMWVCGPVTNPAARALASWLCTLLGRHEGAWRGAFLPGCGA